MMISTFTCLLLALITAHFPANVCGDGEEDLEEGNSHFGYWERGERFLNEGVFRCFGFDNVRTSQLQTASQEQSNGEMPL